MQADTKFDKIALISSEYFGDDKSRNYIKHDFKRALEGVVQREILMQVMIESSKNRHGTERQLDENGNVTSISYGDFDPDNAGFLHAIYKNHELGVMLDLRLLLTKNESGTGGSFVKDLTKLELEDFVYHYFNKKVDSISLPPFLSESFMEARKKNSNLKIEDFISIKRQDIDEAVKLLVSKANKFNNNNYKDKIVASYEALKFHKNKASIKYEVNEVKENMGPMNFSYVNRRDISKVDTELITKSLNELADIVDSYRLLVGSVSGLSGSSWPLETFVKRTFEIFSKDVPIGIQEDVVERLVKYLKESFHATFWSLN